MDALKLPTSLSLFRGQSREGVGEGPGLPIAHGEQYLAAEGDLYDGPLLAAVRPWLSFDSDPADHRTVGEQLEGWSCFSEAGRLFVVRLAAAGTFDRRAAYFAHGRAWNWKDLPESCDPGLHLGRTAAFDEPWRDGARSERREAPAPQLDVGPLKADPQVAARLLGHLFQALIEGYPVLYAVPVAEFVSGGPVASLVAFSRAGLPADLRERCRLRVYTRYPDLFLRHLSADLLALPQEMAGAALAVSRSAVLLDRAGEVMAGPRLDPHVQRYAEAVVERALALPAALPLFSVRFGRLPRDKGLPNEAGARSVQIVYNLAFALSAEETVREQMVARYLPDAARKLGPGLSWRRLIGEDWSRLPESSLHGLLLGGLADSPGERELWATVAAEVGCHGRVIDAEVAAWWPGADAGRLDRLLALLACNPPVVSTACVARCLNGVARRELAEKARVPAVFQALAVFTAQGNLRADWAEDLVREAPEEELPQIADRLLAETKGWETWGDAPGFLLTRLLASRSFVGDTSTLLALAEALPSEVGLVALHRELDRRAASALAETTAILIRAGWWGVWFRRWQPEVLEEEARRPAFAWFCSPVWSEGSVEATREEWNLALASLPSRGVSGEDVRRLCGGGESPRRWPRIPPFEADQLMEMARLCADLGGLAEFAALARREGWVSEPEETVFLGADSVLREGVTEVALHWLRDPLPAELAALDLATSEFLLQRAGHLQNRALLARVRAVAAWLERDALQALDAAVTPNLFGRQDFRNDLVRWLNRPQTFPLLGDDVWRALEARIGDGPPHQVAGVPRALALQIAGDRWGKVAEFLVPGIAAEMLRDDLPSRAVRAMRAGDSEDPCWGEMARAAAAWTRAVPGEAIEHPVEVLVRRIRAGDFAIDEWSDPVLARAWQTFLDAASNGNARLLQPAQGVLPAFNLGLCLTSGGTLGNMALVLVGSKASDDYRKWPEWWQGLLLGLRDPLRRDGQRSADDQLDAALPYLRGAISGLDPTEHAALNEVLGASKSSPWALGA